MEQVWHWSGWLAPKYLGWLIEGLGTTILLAIQASLLASLAGMILAGCRISSNKLVSGAAWLYISFVRNTPLLVQLFFWYFGLPSLLPEHVVEWLNAPHTIDLASWGSLALPGFEFIMGLLGLTCYAAAFIAEEFRAGIRAVPPSQHKAAMALGLTQGQILRHVILPQAARHALPPLLGQYMNVIKSSSLAMAIGVVELSYASRQVETETFKTFQAFGVATLLYILCIVLVELAGQYIQQQRFYHLGRR